MELIHLGAKRWVRGGILPREPQDVPYSVIECGEDGEHWTANVDLFLSLPKEWLCKECYQFVACKYRSPAFRIIQSEIGELTYEHPVIAAPAMLVGPAVGFRGAA